MLRVCTLGVLLLGASSEIVNAQGATSPPLGGVSRPIVGGTWGLPPPAKLPQIGGTQSLGTQVHLGPTGHPCLSVYGFARPQGGNPKIFDHTIHANNACSQPIKLRVCYYQTQHCVMTIVPGYQRKEFVLGIFPSMKDFRFEYREQFDQLLGLGGLR